MVWESISIESGLAIAFSEETMVRGNRVIVVAK